MGRPKRREHLTNIFGDLLDLKKFEDKQIEMPNGCIEYEGINHRQGYQFVGCIRGEKGAFITAHRLAMKLKLNRDLDRKEQVIHTCSNVRCVNPDHLYLGDTRARVKTMKDNGRAPNPIRGKYVRSGKPQNRKYKWPVADMIFFRTHSPAEIRDKYGMTIGESNRLKSGYTTGYKWLDQYTNK